MTEQSLEAHAQAIREAFDTWTGALSRGDIDGYLACYLDSPEARWVSGGEMHIGRDTIVAAAKARMSGAGDMGTVETPSLEIEFLAPPDALVFGSYRQTVGETVSEGVFTVHLRLTDDGWKIRSDHASAL